MLGRRARKGRERGAGTETAGTSLTPRALWVRWVGANAIGELVGLGGTLALVAGLWGVLDRSPLPVALALALAIAAVGALVEGVAVGGLQGLVLRLALPALPLPRWVVFTALGAFVAWSLGMLPSTLLAAGGNGAPAAGAAEPSTVVQLLLAAGMGAALGPFLGVPQWLVLRRFVPRAGWWIPANSAAWALGMPVVFAAMSFVTPETRPATIAAVLAASLLATGAVVGAVHGAVLVRLLAGAFGGRAAGIPGSTPRSSRRGPPTRRAGRAPASSARPTVRTR
ncbi:MAG: hypothetical protein IBX62_09100 [Coriobacteriia bacterium]|nr:hypothetical protein [Coriobacteriia bacterium]